MNKKQNVKRALALSIVAGMLSTGQLGALAADEELAPLPLKTDPLPVKNPADTVAAPMVELPVTPEQALAEKKLILSGAAATAAPKYNLIGAALIATKAPITRYIGPKLKFIEVTIRNNGVYPVVIIGEGVRGLGGGANIAQLPLETLLKLDNHLLSTTDKVAIGAVTLGSAALAGPLAYEVFTAQDHRKRNLGIDVGRDAGRHEIEDSRLNRRVILPQDETKGWIAFYDDAASGISSLLVPLTYPYNSSNGSVTIPISGTTANASLSAIPSTRNGTTTGSSTLADPRPFAKKVRYRP